MPNTDAEFNAPLDAQPIEQLIYEQACDPPIIDENYSHTTHAELSEAHARPAEFYDVEMSDEQQLYDPQTLEPVSPHDQPVEAEVLEPLTDPAFSDAHHGDKRVLDAQSADDQLIDTQYSEGGVPDQPQDDAAPCFEPDTATEEVRHICRTCIVRLLSTDI